MQAGCRRDGMAGQARRRSARHGRATCNTAGAGGGAAQWPAYEAGLGEEGGEGGGGGRGGGGSGEGGGGDISRERLAEAGAPLWPWGL